MEYKNFNIVHDGTFGYKSIKTVGPGTLPVMLGGVFTKTVEATKAIDTYLDIKQEKLDGTKTASSRGK